MPVGQSSIIKLEDLVRSAKHISDIDKAFLLDKAREMKPLEKLQLEQSLVSNQIPESLAQIARLRQRFMALENKPKGNDVFSKIIQTVIPAPQKRLFSKSVLLQPHVSGTAESKAVTLNPAPAMIRNLSEFNNLKQLVVLNPAHVTFLTSDSSDQILDNFYKVLEKLFDAISDVKVKRDYLMTFMQSMLFNMYLNTGMTALRHPELQPRSIALNQMYQIDNRKYLNKTQFQHTSNITSEIRSLCGL
jgi:hypothetical protein